MKTIKRICFIGLLFLLPIVGICQSYGRSEIDGLKSGNALTVQYAQDIILRKWGQRYWGQRNFEKERTISELINIIESDSTKVDTFVGYTDEQRKEKILSDSVTAASLILGAMRVTESIPVLVKHINYETPGMELPVNTLIGLDLYKYPCAIALTSMGDTAIPYLMKIIKNPPDSMTQYIAGETIRLIHGNIEPIEAMLQSSTDTTEQQNLKNLLAHYPNFKAK